MTDKSNALPDGTPGQLRQGDVWGFPIDRKSMMLGSKKTRRFVVAQGEGTGHDHVLEGEDMTVVVTGGNIFADLPHGGYLVHTSGEHPDHEKITIVPGSYIFVRQSDNVGMEKETYVRD